MKEKNIPISYMDSFLKVVNDVYDKKVYRNMKTILHQVEKDYIGYQKIFYCKINIKEKIQLCEL
jgi:hypothetical protein